MNRRILAFANHALAIEWEDAHGEELVRFLFAAVPEGQAEQVRVTLHLTNTGKGQIGVRPSGAPGRGRSGEMGEMAVYLMERACYFLADGSRGGALFHAACLCRGGKGLLLPGSSGSGKTTLAAWLALNGWQYCTDELTFIPAGALECQGLTRPLHLKGQAERLFPGLLEKGALAVKDGWLTPPWMLGDSPAGEPAVLQRIIFPHYQAEADGDLQPLTRASAAILLTGLLINARNLPENGFPEILHLAHNVPAFRLDYSDFEQLKSKDFLDLF